MLPTLFLFLACAFAAQINVSPGQNWCTIANTAKPGDEVVLASGNYPDPCYLYAAGNSSSPVVIRSATKWGAKMTYSGGSTNVIEVRSPSKFLTLKWISFTTTQTGVFAVRLVDVSDITIDTCHFSEIQGSAITANSNANTARITVRGCEFWNIPYTVMYFGCQDGTSCVCSDFLVEDNIITATSASFVTGSLDGTGYCFESKRNSYGVLRRNTFYNAKGPDIAVYGTGNNALPFTIVEGNLLSGSTNESPLWIGGGRVAARNNVLIHLYGRAPLNVQDYFGAGIMRNISITFNTLIANAAATTACNLQWSSGSANELSYNLVLSGALPSSTGGASAVGNLACTTIAGCTMSTSESAPWNLFPNSVVTLVTIGSPSSNHPTTDFVGYVRQFATGTSPGAIDAKGPTCSSMTVSGFPNARGGLCTTTPSEQETGSLSIAAIGTRSVIVAVITTILLLL